MREFSEAARADGGLELSYLLTNIGRPGVFTRIR